MNNKFALHFAKCFVIGIFIVAGTFPDNDWSYSTGVDSPLAWVYNYFFENGLSMGQHVIFPHGPLAFFMYPLQENILLATLITSVLKVLLVFNLSRLLSDFQTVNKWLITLVFAYTFSIFADFIHLILLNLLLLYCNDYLVHGKIFKWFLFPLTAFAFYIKADVAIIACILFFSFLIHITFQHKNIKLALLYGFLLLTAVLLVWVIMYGTPRGFIRYVTGMIQLAQDNSNAVAYYPYNNWLLLGIFLTLLPVIFLFNRTKKTIFYGTLTGLSLFAAWKHGITREDIYHVNGFYVYLMCALGVFVIFNREKFYSNLLLSVIAVALLYMNMKNAVNYFPAKYAVFSFGNFTDFISEFSGLKEKSAQKTQSRIAVHKLRQNILDSIAASTTDVYPWDYSIIAANNLTWKPRTVLQSYASYTPWLDEQNAIHFNSGESPDYILWETGKISKDINGGSFNSIDNRYLLNDEPRTVLQILKNYNYWYAGDKFIILKKKIIPVDMAIKNIDKSVTSWGRWLKAPEDNGNIVRVKLKFHKTVLQHLKSFFFKDEQFWIYLKLNTGLIHKYRIVPKNAEDGIWINPYLFNSEHSYRVEEIMFKASNQTILTEQLNMEWEQIMFSDTTEYVYNFFHVNNTADDSIIEQSLNGFEQPTVKNWTDFTAEHSSGYSFRGAKSHIVQGSAYSLTYSINLDSIPFQKLKISADCWVQAANYMLQNIALLVISIENENAAVVWQGIPLDEQLIDGNYWNNIFNFINYSHNQPNCTLKVYVWNTGKNEIFVDDFRVTIQK